MAEKLEQHAQDHCDKLFKSKLEKKKFDKDNKQAEDSTGIKREVLKDSMLLKEKQEKLLECIKINKTGATTVGRIAKIRFIF